MFYKRNKYKNKTIETWTKSFEAIQQNIVIGVLEKYLMQQRTPVVTD